jgi:hypothetical protein
MISWTSSTRHGAAILFTCSSLLPRSGLLATPNGIEIAGELARVDLDRRYSCGLAVGLDDYLQLFPQIAESPATLLEVAFEDYRARKSRGLAVKSERWRRVPGIVHVAWYQELLQSERDGYPAFTSDSCMFDSGTDRRGIEYRCALRRVVD